VTVKRPGSEVPTPPEPRRDGPAREFARRIECDAAGPREPHAVAARGRGVRDPEAWARLRDARG
jgi:hypothetical protein